MRECKSQGKATDYSNDQFELFLSIATNFGISATDYETWEDLAEALFSRIDTEILKLFIVKSTSDTLIELIRNELKKRGELL